MISFFGIFSPGRLPRAPTDEAPAKARFFSSPPDAPLGAVPMSRAEQEACHLAAQAPAPEPAQDEQR
ncbi:MAG: hypothetical protein ABS75_27325 [Pelagibacterium sp. SCN 63-23]|mgnify:CR=1 FL=1|nr:MAG: hypothetical protein ABS75_27325 [Pelagibacterium sp. SCN 63-23]